MKIEYYREIHNVKKDRAYWKVVRNSQNEIIELYIKEWPHRKIDNFNPKAIKWERLCLETSEDKVTYRLFQYFEDGNRYIHAEGTFKLLTEKEAFVEML